MRIFAPSIDRSSRSPRGHIFGRVSPPETLARDRPAVAAQAPLSDIVGQAARSPDAAPRAVLIPYQQAGTDAFRAQWVQLSKNSTDPNPFYAPWFLLPSMTWLGRCQIGKQATTENLSALAGYGDLIAGDQQMPPRFAKNDGKLDKSLQLFCLFQGGVLQALMPIIRSTDYYDNPLPHITNWRHPNIFCGAPLMLPGSAHTFWQELLNLADKQAGHSAFLHIAEIPEASQSCAALREVLTTQDREASIVERAERAALDSELSADAYFVQSMTQKKRKELRRQRNRLSELGNLAFERRNSSDQIEEWIDAFLALEAAGWKGEAASALASQGDTAKFFRAAMTEGTCAGNIERLTLALNDRPIAMLANLISPPAAYSFKTAYDENYARFSPGVLLQQENLDLLDRRNIRWADSCAREGHPMIERIWRERRTIISINIAIGGAIRRKAFRFLARYETGRNPGRI